MAKKKKVRNCGQCVFLSKDGEDWICGCGNGLVEPFFEACNEYEGE